MYISYFGKDKWIVLFFSSNDLSINRTGLIKFYKYQKDDPVIPYYQEPGASFLKLNSSNFVTFLALMNSRIFITIVLSYIIGSIHAYDPDALQDLCVADKLT